MHQELVELRRWISQRRFLHALNDCMLPPGPGAQQLAAYIGWLMHETRGGRVACALFALLRFSSRLRSPGSLCASDICRWWLDSFTPSSRP